VITASINSTTSQTQRHWLLRYKWLILRRTSQFSILSLFILSPMTDSWFIKGNLSSSLVLNSIPLTDPYLLIQSFFAGHSVTATVLIGTAIVSLFYLTVGGRVYCSWVCPVNIATDTAGWLRRKLKIKSASLFIKSTRYWLLGISFLLAFISGTLAWELVNPVTIIQRGLISGLWISALLLLVIFIFDLFMSRDAWCGHICPVGAFYSLFGRFGFVRISAYNRQDCDDCMDCYSVCPEQQVIKPVLKNTDNSPVITGINCTNCGRCIDVCDKNVFKVTNRFNHSTTSNEFHSQESFQ